MRPMEGVLDLHQPCHTLLNPHPSPSPAGRGAWRPAARALRSSYRSPLPPARCASALAGGLMQATIGDRAARWRASGSLVRSLGVIGSGRGALQLGWVRSRSLGRETSKQPSAKKVGGDRHLSRILRDQLSLTRRTHKNHTTRIHPPHRHNSHRAAAAQASVVWHVCASVCGAA